MICSAKPERDKLILSSERMLHKGYDSNGSVVKKKKKTLVVSLQGLDAKTNLMAVNRKVVK
jgi:hypothetical protein